MLQLLLDSSAISDVNCCFSFALEASSQRLNCFVCTNSSCGKFSSSASFCPLGFWTVSLLPNVICFKALREINLCPMHSGKSGECLKQQNIPCIVPHLCRACFLGATPVISLLHLQVLRSSLQVWKQVYRAGRNIFLLICRPPSGASREACIR